MEPTAVSPFWEKVALLVIDKVLLAAAGAVIAYIAAKALERYRRQQTVTLEFGKLRAQAFARALVLLTEYQLLLDRLLVTERTEEHEAAARPMTEQFQAMSKDFFSNMAREAALLDKDSGLLLMEYVAAIVSVDKARVMAGPLSPAEMEERKAKLRDIREKLLLHFPPLPRAD